MLFLCYRLTIIASLIIVLLPTCARADETWKKSFHQSVEAILKRHCYECHGQDEPQRELQLTDIGGVLRGGASGTAIQPGRPSESLLIHLVKKGGDPHMPPNGQLSDVEIKKLETWIKLLPKSLSVGRSQHGVGTQHWAFEPPKRPAVPIVDNVSWLQNPIDAFVLSRLEKAKLDPSPSATPIDLVRRATIDLTGLPPSREQVEFFNIQSSQSPDQAYSALINRLLCSPHYGERWGRHWLDLARYADSNGFEFDMLRPYAWRYRDWVIDSFNSNKPYDQFVIEQIAGDEIQPATLETFVATGFCRNGPTVGNQSLEQHRWDELDDVISTTAEVFLGLTLGCARCHDHKYDPITQRDYYSMLAIFNSTSKQQRLIANSDVRAAWSTLQKTMRDLRARKREIGTQPAAGRWKIENGELVQERMATNIRLFLGDRNWTDYTVEVEVAKTGGTEKPFNYDAGIGLMVRATPNNDSYWIRLGLSDNREHGLVSEINGGRINLTQNIAGTVARNRWYRLRVTVQGNSLRVWIDDRFAFDVEHRHHTKGGIGFGNWLATTRWRNLLVTDSNGNILQRGFPSLEDTKSPDFVPGDETTDDINEAIEKLESKAARFPLAMSIVDTGRQPRETRLFLRGDYRTPGPVVPPAVPTVLTRKPVQFPTAAETANTTFRRTQLGRWLMSSDNALTARVMVNRIWHYHFGRGLVDTPSNFGIRGTLPSHPELLDWLAVEFMESGWDIKHIHRLIMTSATYRQASRMSDAAGSDPNNRLLWRYPKRRLEAELIRDRILAASGSLNTSMRGPGIHPRVHPSVIATSTTRKWPTVKSEASEHWRRSVYIFVRRSVLMPMLEAFDSPTTTQSCERRLTTTVPTQALQLMNDAFTNDQALLMAKTIETVADDDFGTAIDEIYWRALSRTPTAGEKEDCRTFLLEQRQYHSRSSSTQQARTLAWADLCHVMFNTNEFVYID